MAATDVTVTVRDRGLGLLSGAGAGVHVKMGVSSAGALNTLQSLADPADIPAAIGYGPLADATDVALNTAVDGRRPSSVRVMRLNASTAGAAGGVTPARVGTSTGTVATTGSTPYDAFQVIVEITRTGTLGAAAFRYSLDNGDTYSDEIAVPGGGTYVVPNAGVTLVFAAGAGPTFFEDGDLFTFTTTAPYYNTTDVANGVAALLSAGIEFEFIHLVGAPASAAALATLFAAVATHTATFQAAGQYIFVLLEAPDDTDNNLVSNMAASASVRVSVAAGYDERPIASSGRVLKRSAAWEAAGRIAAVPLSHSIGRFESGPVEGLVSLYRDERKTPALDDARFTTLRTYVGEPGFYFTQGRIMAPAGSDFSYIENRRVMDRACTVGRRALLKYKNRELRVAKVTGLLLEAEAAAIDTFIAGQVRAAIGEHCSDLSVQTVRTDNLISSQRLRAKVRVIPLAYARELEMEIGFANPQLVQV
jgi:Protein of unknown function (DUF2586)